MLQQKRLVLGSLVIAFATVFAWHSPTIARADSGPLTVSEPSYDYGTHDVGTETSHHFTIRNDGTATAMLDFRTANGITDFDIRNDACVSLVTLTVGASCGFDVVFTPSAPGPLDGSAVYHYDVGLATLVFSGTGEGGATTGPPTVTVPDDMTVDATSPDGTPVAYKATAADANGNALTPTCTHPSGWMFPVGTTGVTCTATDGSGSSASATFNVSVVGAGDQLNDLINLLAGMNLPGGLGIVLHNDLANAAKKLGSPPDACGLLAAFVDQVLAKADDKITISQAEALLAAANAVEQALGCISASSAWPGAEAGLLELVRTTDAMALGAGETTMLEDKAIVAARSLAAAQPGAACVSLADLSAQIARDSGKKSKLTTVQATLLATAVAAVQSEVC